MKWCDGVTLAVYIYNVIVTQNTGAIKYSVSDSVEEKGTTVKRKKPPCSKCLVSV